MMLEITKDNVIKTSAQQLLKPFATLTKIHRSTETKWFADI